MFPSYYEPWGFKAEECIAMGVPVIVSNLSGFGCYAEETIGENANDDYGVYITIAKKLSTIRICMNSRF